MAQITQLDDTILGLIPLQPKRPYIESLEWFTEIVPSYNGNEETSSNRPLPRHSYRTEFCAHPEAARDVFNTVYGGLVRLWAIPLWAQGRNVGGIAAGAESIVIDTTTSDYRVDTPVFLTDGCGKWQCAYITAVNAGSLDLDRELEQMSLAFAMPIRIGRIKGTPTKTTGGFDARYTVEYEVDDNIEYDPAAPTQYYSNDIYFDYNLLDDSSEVSQQFITERETFDEELGIVEEFTPWLNNRTIQPYRVVKTSQAETWALRMFLHRRRGRWPPFWMPSFEADLRPLSIGALTTTLFVELDSYLPWAEARKNIAIKKTDGTWIARRITNAIVSAPEVVQLTLDASLAMNASQIQFISWLGFKRLDTDKVDLQYIGNNHCVSTFPLVEIKP